MDIDYVDIETVEFLSSILVANIILRYWSILSFIVSWEKHFIFGYARTCLNIHVFYIQYPMETLDNKVQYAFTYQNKTNNISHNNNIQF